MSYKLFCKTADSTLFKTSVPCHMNPHFPSNPVTNELWRMFIRKSNKTRGATSQTPRQKEIIQQCTQFQVFSCVSFALSTSRPEFLIYSGQSSQTDGAVCLCVCVQSSGIIIFGPRCPDVTLNLNNGTRSSSSLSIPLLSPGHIFFSVIKRSSADYRLLFFLLL